MLTKKYKITLKSLGRTFKAEGTTLEKAIDKIKVSGGARVTSTLTVERGTKTKERILSGRTTGHLFGQGSPTTRFIHLKKVLSMFDL